MSKQIALAEINSPYFWFMYLKWFRGFDDKNEINLDEAMEVIEIDQSQSHQYEEDFFSDINDESIKFIDEKLSDGMSLRVEFRENEIVFFLNEIYIGNLGGHFEAWFLTWNELVAFEKYPSLFLLLLPMAGVERAKVEEARDFIAKQLKTIPSFEKEAGYVAYCIVNGLMIDEAFFEQQDIGILNRQNHSVRNIEKYPAYENEVKILNLSLKLFVSSKS